MKNMNENLISVMVPCYNTEKYLAKCIESILNQTYKNIELLLINDGSTDSSLQIMKDYAAKDNRIVIIDRENKGLSYSRNEALRVAKGDYLTFVDSDDTIALDYCEKMINALLETDSDISICHVHRLYDGDTPNPSNRSGKQVYNKYELLYSLICKAEHFDIACAKLFKRKVLENIEYPVGRIYEDTATTYKIFCNADKAVELYDELYFYLLKRQGSITGAKYTYKSLNDNYLLITERYNYLSKNVENFDTIAKLGYIRNILTLLDRVYLSEDEELINSDMVKKLLKDLVEVYNAVKNSPEFDILVNTYKRCCLYFILNGRMEDYSNMIHFVQNK